MGINLVSLFWQENNKLSISTSKKLSSFLGNIILQIFNLLWQGCSFGKKIISSLLKMDLNIISLKNNLNHYLLLCSQEMKIILNKK